MYDTPFEKFKLLVGVKDNLQDHILRLVWEQALNAVLGYTRRSQLSPPLISVVIRLAVIYYNKLGAEGETARTEGAVSRSFESGIPEDIRTILNRYIKVRVL